MAHQIAFDSEALNYFFVDEKQEREKENSETDTENTEYGEE